MQASVKVYDLTGRLCRTLTAGKQTPGCHDLVWNLRDNRGCQAASGIYFCRLETSSQTQTRKLVVQRYTP